MAEKYQRCAKKSTKKFELLGRKEVAVRLPLPLVEMWEELQPEVEHLTGLAGLKIIRAVIEDEVTRRVGPRYRPTSEQSCLRWGQQPGYVVFAGQKVPVDRPRVRTREGEEVELESYARLQHDGRRQRAVREGIVAGLTSRNYQRAVHSVLDGYGIEKSSVSREFVQASAAQLKKLCEKNLAGLELVAILIDGIHLGKQVLVVALGIESSGKKHVLGLWQGATENTVVVKDLLEDLVTRGLDAERRYLFVIDGAKALRAAIEREHPEGAGLGEATQCALALKRTVARIRLVDAKGSTRRGKVSHNVHRRLVGFVAGDVGVVANIEESFARMANSRRAAGIVRLVKRHLARNHGNENRAGVTVPTAAGAGLKRDHLHSNVKSRPALDHYSPVRGLLPLHMKCIAVRRLIRRPAEEYGSGRGGGSPEQPYGGSPD
jgi:Transposase, Mutator family